MGDTLGELQLLSSYVPLHQEEDQHRTAERGNTADLLPLLLPRKTGTPDSLETLRDASNYEYLKANCVNKT